MSEFFHTFGGFFVSTGVVLAFLAYMEHTIMNPPPPRIDAALRDAPEGGTK